MQEKPTDGGGNASRAVVTRRDDTAGGSHLRNTRSHYFLRGEHTGGAFSMVEILFAGDAPGTPMHVHTREEETYYVIEGALLIQVGDTRSVLGPGGSVVLPRGVKHKVTPVSGEATRALMIVTPPGFEEMLMRLDAIKPGDLDMEAVSRLSAEYGVQLAPDE